MTYKCLLAILIISLLSFQPASACETIPESKIPDEVKSFIEQGTILISINSADLNGDGLSDYILVIEKQKKHDDDPDIEEGQRPLLIIIREANGTLKLRNRNDKVIYCESCGGRLGDPFESIEAGPETFTINHYGGSAWRWASKYKFNYSRRDNTWQLVRVEDITFHTSNPEKAITKIYTPPKHFGKIDINEFDPENYKGKGKK